MSKASSWAGLLDNAVACNLEVLPTDDSNGVDTPDSILRRRLSYVQKLLTIEMLHEGGVVTPEASGKAYREIYLRKEIGLRYRERLVEGADVYQLCFPETKDARKKFIAGANEGYEVALEKLNKLLSLEEHDGWPLTNVGLFRAAFPWAYLAISLATSVVVAVLDPGRRRNTYQACEDGIKVFTTLLAIAALIIKAVSRDTYAVVHALTGRRIMTNIDDVSAQIGVKVKDIKQALASYPVEVPWAKMSNTCASRAKHSGKLHIDMSCSVTAAIRRGYVITDKVIDTSNDHEGIYVSAGPGKIHILWDPEPANVPDSDAIPYKFTVG